MPGASGWPLSLSASAGACASVRPSTRSISSRGRPPGRSSIGASKQPTMVDSTPTSTGPPSTMRSIRPSRSLFTCAAVRRRDMAGEIGRRRHHGLAERAQDRARDRMRGNADRDGVEPGGRKLGHRAARCLRQHQRQRARPEGLGEAQGSVVETADLPRGGEIADMRDQRIEGGPALGLVELGDRRRRWWRRRRGRRRSRSGTRPARRRQARARRRPRRPRRRAKSAVVRPTFMRLKILKIGFLRCAKPKAISRGLSRSVAQPGRALRSGRRGRRFESCHSDHLSQPLSCKTGSDGSGFSSQLPQVRAQALAGCRTVIACALFAVRANYDVYSPRSEGAGTRPKAVPKWLPLTVDPVRKTHICVLATGAKPMW